MQSNFRMVMRSGPSVGKVYPLEKNELFVGRDLSNDIVINDPEISRRHARLYAQGNSYVLEDLGSTNGSFVNGQRLMGPNVLRPGDTVTFGERMSMVFESSDYDQDATMVSPSARPSFGGQNQGPAQVYTTPPAQQPEQQQQPAQQAYQQPPAYQQPAQQAPAYQQPAYEQPPVSVPPARPVENYAGQIPSAYSPEVAPPPARKIPTIWIVLGILLLLTCVCLFVAAWNAPRSFWCLFPVWPAGYCP
jgi:predicted component of type VI protein secretion system